MTEKRFIGYDFGEYENRNYAVYDLSKSEKTKEDFWDNEEECYDIWAFVDYLEENDCVLSCDEVVGLLNKLYEENKQLRQIMNDIVVATDETYAKNASVFKVTVVLDFEKYMEIRRCIE